MELLGKYLYLGINLSWPENGLYRVLRRINRETPSQFISDVQRSPNSRNDWENWKHFNKIARRYRKKNLFNDKGELTTYYGETTTLIEDDLSIMQSDLPFKEMFKIVKGNSRDDLFDYELKNSYNILGFYKKPNKSKPSNVCLDTNGPIGQLLKKDFGVDVYVVDRIWNTEKQTHFRYEYSRKEKYERNAVFHQVTAYGGDEKLISKEENEKNRPIFMWFFENKIVYMMADGRSEH